MALCEEACLPTSRLIKQKVGVVWKRYVLDYKPTVLKTGDTPKECPERNYQ
jgi:hypothetical protein